jgi:hypothetical protein
VVLANVKDGSTCTFDLTEPDDQQALADLIRDELITGLSLHSNGHTASLPAPRRFKRPLFGFDLLSNGKAQAERIFAQADGVRVSLTRTLTSKHIRCDLVRTGALRYNPATDRSKP